MKSKGIVLDILHLQEGLSVTMAGETGDCSHALDVTGGPFYPAKTQ
jgi:hypothetical protein